jgi:mediator of RNA polymerase II transcription subunit 17, fungi type
MGEMSLARDVLASFLTSAAIAGTSAPSGTNPLAQSLPNFLPPPPSDPNLPPPLAPDALMASSVAQYQPLMSVHAVNAMVTVGSKDESLRKAADIFRSAANSVERGRQASDQYWLNALKLRRQNWPLLPAPLPFGTSTLAGSSNNIDSKSTKDFLVFFGLSECMSNSISIIVHVFTRCLIGTAAPAFRRNALASLSSRQTDTSPIIIPQRQHLALRVTLTTTDKSGSTSSAFSRIHRRSPSGETASPDELLREAQRAILEQEIFGLLVRDAAHLSYASTRVSERLIVLEAAQGVELRFEFVRFIFLFNYRKQAYVHSRLIKPHLMIMQNLINPQMVPTKRKPTLFTTFYLSS